MRDGGRQFASRELLRHVALVLVLTAAFASCRTAAPQPPRPGEQLRGVASWYGQEFAGRTTANGEIFDPSQLTAAHRTFPFGTVLDVRNVKTQQTVRVRINDRGPFVGKRIIDLSYGAAQVIGLVEPGIGDVELKVVSVGRGDREPPAPYVVTVATPPPPVATPPAQAGAAPEVVFPLPGGATASGTPPVADVTSVAVVEERGGVEVRRQVSEDGKTITTVPVERDPSAPVASAPGHSAAERIDRAAASAPPSRPARPRRGEFVVQVGAFSVEENAVALQERLSRIGQKSQVDHEELYRVRIGPFRTRDEAIAVRTTLESHGLSAIVVAE
jgi:rare lipoprotein A